MTGSKVIDNGIEQISRLPGIGKKTALRLALHIIGNDKASTTTLVQSLVDLITLVKRCTRCNNLSDGELCGICSSGKRDEELLLVVEDIRDVMAIENTGQYRGLYHVLGGLISPIQGIGPNDLTIQMLQERVRTQGIKEVIFALSTTMEGDTTTFYINRVLQALEVRKTSIARGVPLGSHIEYADEITLGRSIATRQLYQ